MTKSRKTESNLQIEKTGRSLRKMMKWIDSKEIEK
jgi:ketol-acid reductoisomerase